MTNSRFEGMKSGSGPWSDVVVRLENLVMMEECLSSNVERGTL